jgi:hypothetical protein
MTEAFDVVCRDIAAWRVHPVPELTHVSGSLAGQGMGKGVLGE